MHDLNTDSPLPFITEIPPLRRYISTIRANGQKIGFVPTMGALHAGHLSLVTKALEKADCVIASIFVNPSQFAVGEDFSTYPRDAEGDIVKLAQAGCSAIYLPAPQTIYPDDFSTAITVGEISHSLCGVSRPHFFGGVATVVCKLLNQVQPDIAVFGEKDFQQLLVIRRMVRDLDLPVNIIGGPIVREADGLAMSSRNVNLSKEGRKRAGALNGIMHEAADAICAGAHVGSTLDTAIGQILAAGFTTVDYLEVRSALDLGLLSGGPLLPEMRPHARLFAAAMIDQTRLIDNMAICR